LFYDEPADTPYESYAPQTHGGANEIRVVDARGVRRFAEISPMTEALTELMFRRIHVKAEWKGVVEKAIGRATKSSERRFRRLRRWNLEPVSHLRNLRNLRFQLSYSLRVFVSSC